jgi:hypothetical protein
MDTCTKKKQAELFKDFFTRYGTYEAETAEKTIHIWQQHPEKLYAQSDVLKYIESANKDIERLELTIAMLQAYKMELVKRYNYLETTPTRQKIKLQRYKKYRGNVFYYIVFYTVDLTTGHEEETQRKTYKGAERKQAFSDFETICKGNPQAIIEKDIEKSRWEA